MENPNTQDDILFEQLKKAKRRKRRKVVITVLVLLLLAGAGIVTAVTVLRNRVRTQFAAATAEVLSYEAERGRISTTVSGSGSLSYPDSEDITVPSGVEVEEILVRPGDTLNEGDTIAAVDVNSVMTALADVQSQLEDLDDQINDAKNDTVSTYMTSAVTGRVKCIYAQAGDNVVDVMTEHGALAILSLDGLMTVTIDAQLTPGDSVTVASQEKTYAGTVESCLAGKSVVSLTDNGPTYQAEARVLDGEGNALGTGTLAIRNPLSVTGYAGTISYVNVRENSQIWSGGSLFTLTNTGYTANYDTLLRTRTETEQTLNELIGLLRTGSVTAPFSGIVTQTNTDTDSTAVQTIAVLAADDEVCVSISVDETDILSLELGQTAQVTIKSVGEDSFTGTVTEISKVGTSSSGVTQYSAVVTLEKQPKMLSGMTASVDIQIQGVDDVVLIPVEALHQTRDMSYVFTSYDEELKEYGGMVEVVTGASNSSYVEIVSGLNPGDTVYYTEKAANGFSFIMPNMGGNMGGGSMPSFGGSTGSMPMGGTDRGNRGGDMGGFSGNRPGMGG